MIVLVTYRPLYTSNLIPALIIYILLSYYKRKTELPEKRKKRIIYMIMVLALFIAFNTVLQIFPVPATETAWGTFTEILTEKKVTLAMCNIGQFIIFTSTLQALSGLKKMDEYSFKGGIGYES